MKSYILIKDSISVGNAIVASAHCGTILGMVDDDITKLWRNSVFRKTVCKVSDTQFEEAKNYPRHTILTESSLDDREVALVFFPRKNDEWPKHFSFFPLYK